MKWIKLWKAKERKNTKQRSRMCVFMVKIKATLYGILSYNFFFGVISCWVEHQAAVWHQNIIINIKITPNTHPLLSSKQGIFGIFIRAEFVFCRWPNMFNFLGELSWKSNICRGYVCQIRCDELALARSFHLLKCSIY